MQGLGTHLTEPEQGKQAQSQEHTVTEHSIPTGDTGPH